MALRNIRYNWVEELVAEPLHREPDPNDPQIERFYGQVEELGGRYLRVVVNTVSVPWRVVTVFVDGRVSEGK